MAPRKRNGEIPMKTWRICMLAMAMAPFLAAQNAVEPAAVPVEEEPHHHVLLKNDWIVVMRVSIPEGERTFYHTHGLDRGAVGLSKSVITQQMTNELEGPPLSRQPGDVSMNTGDVPVTHRVHNVGPGTFEVIDVEFLRRPQEPSRRAAADVLGENACARAYRWTLAPGFTSATHTHERPYLIVAVTGFPLKMTAPDGSSATHEVKAGDFHWVDAKVTHALSNEGPVEAQIVEIEMK
jgi:quercetin dioxygenase-like cupin family protein